MAAYETGDSGHLAYGLMNMFNYPIFSQYNYYFTSDYGWIFNDISFLVILLLKFVGKLFGVYNQPIFGVIDNQPFFNGAMITTNFTFALLSISVFFKLANLLFANKKISFIASLFLYCFCMFSTDYIQQNVSWIFIISDFFTILFNIL